MGEAPSGGLETAVNPTSKTPPGDNKLWFVLATSSEFNVIMLLAGDDVVWRINMHMVDRNSVMSPKTLDVGVFELVDIMGLELGWSLPNATRFETFIVKYSTLQH